MRIALGLMLLTLLLGPAHAQEGGPHPARPSLVDRFDANKDGVLTEDELPQAMRRVFGVGAPLGVTR